MSRVHFDQIAHQRLVIYGILIFIVILTGARTITRPLPVCRELRCHSRDIQLAIARVTRHVHCRAAEGARHEFFTAAAGEILLGHELGK